MPISADLFLDSKRFSDLHILVGLGKINLNSSFTPNSVNENNTSRMTIAAGDKILKGLYADEQFKILPVLMEVISKCSNANRVYYRHLDNYLECNRYEYRTTCEENDQPNESSFNEKRLKLFQSLIKYCSIRSILFFSSWPD